jgi:hypothetical protein
MPKRATVRLGGPKTRAKLHISGYCPTGQEKGALPLSVQVDGKALGSVRIQPGTERFDSISRCRLSWWARNRWRLEVRTFTPPGEDRELGVVFGVFEIR